MRGPPRSRDFESLEDPSSTQAPGQNTLSRVGMRPDQSLSFQERKGWGFLMADVNQISSHPITFQATLTLPPLYLQVIPPVIFPR